MMTYNGLEVWFYYDASGTPYALKYNGAYYYYVTNLQGDVTAILTGGGTMVAQYEYDAWGNITVFNSRGTIGYLNPLFYRGYVYDQETGLYYLQSRYYNPEVGRFINADALVSTGQGLLGNNMFAYCRNNPVCRVDIEGYTDASCYDEDGRALSSEDIEGHAEGGGGSSYNAPPGGGGVTNSQNVGDKIVTFGHGGRHVNSADVLKIESTIAEHVVKQPPSLSGSTPVTVGYNGGVIEYRYITRGESLIHVGTYYYVSAVCY